MNDEAMMALALREAHKAATEDEVPVGCIIVHAGKVVGRAHNQCETLNDPTAHAEMLAITQATEAVGDQRLVEATVYVTLEPCPMCASALTLARVKRLVFGAADAKMGGVVSKYRIPTERKLNHAIDVVEGVCEEECRLLLQEFFRAKRKAPPSFEE